MAADPTVTFEDRIRAALASATTSLRQQLDADLHTLTQEMVRASTDDRQQAVAAAAAAAAAEVRAQADLQLGQLRAVATKHAEELKRAAEAQIGELRRALEELRAQAQQQIENARRVAHTEIEKARSDAHSEVEKAHAEIETARAAEQRASAEARRLQEEAARAQAEADLSHADAESARTQAKADVEAAQAQARTEIQTANERAQSEIEAARAAAKAEVDAARAEAKSEVDAARAEAKAEVDAARATAKAEVEAALAEAKAEIEAGRVQSQAALDQARADAQAARSQAVADLERALGEAEAARKEADVARAHAKAEAERAIDEIEKGRKQSAAEAEEVVISRLAAAHTAGERRVSDAIDRALTNSHQSELARASRLAEAFRSLDEARGLSEILERLVQCAGLEVDRAAVLLVKGRRLAGWRLAGFTPNGPPAKSIDLSVEEAGLAGRVMETGSAASRPSETSDANLPPFAAGAGDRHAMALPVRVGGEVVAVLYADAPRLDAPSSDARWPAILEVLVRHASRALEAMTVQQAAGLSLPRLMTRVAHGSLPGPVEHAGTGDEDTARRYARLLLSEIRMYHEPVVDAARQSHDLLTRLQGEIDRARRLYEARVPETLAAREEYFEQELVRTLAGGDRTLLGEA